MKASVNLFIAISTMNAERAKEILSEGPELHDANYDIFDRFLELYSHFDVEHRIPLLKAFLENGANPNLVHNESLGPGYTMFRSREDGLTPMHTIFQRFLIDYNFALLLKKDSTPITIEFETTLNTLIKHGGNINIKNKNGETPLVYAIKVRGRGPRSTDFIKIALRLGADPLIENNQGKNLFDDLASHEFSRKWATVISAIHEEGLSKRRDAIKC